MAELAGSVVSSFFSVLFEKLADEAVKKIARAQGIRSELKKWKRHLLQIQILLNDASQKAITDEAVKAWLNGLQHLAYDMDDFFDELATDAMDREFAQESGSITSKVRKLIPTCCTNFSLPGELDNISNRLRDLMEEKKTFDLEVKPNEKPKVTRGTGWLGESGFVGREGEKKALLEKLLEGKDESCNQNFSIVPIVGMGGVGKTTLARLVYDEKEVKDHFEVRAWVTVSEEFSISNISQVIYEYVTGENKKFASLNLLQEALREKLMKKLFLIVLDDVWSENHGEWENLVGPFYVGAPGSKIIMTTRKMELLAKLGYSVHQLQSLSDDESLSLFARHALGVDNFDSHLTFRPYGVEFVKKCKGLPLALRALGSFLRTKTDQEFWQMQLDSEIWNSKGGDEIIPALRLSYYDLPASLKLLFAYCSLFPKDYVFDKEELILLWMAEGFLDQSATSKPMARLVIEYFDELLSRSFFQPAPHDRSLFVMHDLMHDLATFAAGEFFARLDIEMKEEFSKEALEKYRHMSFVCERYMVYKRFEPLMGATRLRTFLATFVRRKGFWDSFYISNKVLNDLLHKFPMLRVLSLSQLVITEVPESIGGLKHLRYLNLSQTGITCLPNNVCNLYNLQTLIVFGCDSLEELPNNFLKLRNLRHFDMRGTPLLKKMPLGIGGLKRLQTLSKIIIEEDNGFSITELKDLKDLQGKISFMGLEKVRSPMHAQEANLSQKRLSELEVEWNDEFDDSREETLEKEVLNVLKPDNDHLKKLKIVSYGGRQFPDWVGDPSFLHLAQVLVNGCKKCTSLPPLGQLPSLKQLFIRGMDEVKVVGLEFLGTTGLAFPSLETLCFVGMKGWEVWSTNSCNTSFPCLQVLRLDSCPKLVKISLEALPSLSVLETEKCGHGVLTSLVHVASSVTKLQISNISGLTDELWRGVMKNLGKVEAVTIRECNEIRYLWKSEAEASNVLVNLRELVVLECSNLVSLAEKEEEDCGSNLTSLTSLKVWRCNSMEVFSCPYNIDSLTISECGSITSVSFPTGGGQKLKSLYVRGCKEFLENEFVGGLEKTKMLESLCIREWPNLKSITELSSFNHLGALVISKCPDLESFPDHELPKLSVLTRLVITDCQSMDASFPRGLWPPKLCYLEIGRLKKPISEWSPQKFPASLVELWLLGGPSEDVRDFSQLPFLLPSSLTSLVIDGFEKVESLSRGLRHLTSLQHLRICNSPKARDLPETLLPSLHRLDIRGCPQLAERIRGGAYWPDIPRIPCTDIF